MVSVRQTFGKQERERIKRELFAYAEKNDMGSILLARAISDAHPNQVTIDNKRLRRMRAGTHDPDDTFYGWCDLFLKSVASGADRMDNLARSMIAFYGPRSCTHYAGDYAVYVKLSEATQRSAAWAVWAGTSDDNNDPLVATGLEKPDRSKPDRDPGFCVVKEKGARFLDGVMVGVVDGAIVLLQDRMTRASKTYVLRQLEGHVADPKSDRALPVRLDKV